MKIYRFFLYKLEFFKLTSIFTLMNQDIFHFHLFYEKSIQKSSLELNFFPSPGINQSIKARKIVDNISVISVKARIDDLVLILN